MTTKIILFFALLMYSIIVSQSFMYILALKNAQLGLDINSYIEVRKLIDASMRSNFKYIIYGALISNLLLVIFTFKNPGSLLFITACIGFIALVADTLLTVKGSLPINDIINTWSADQYPSNWADVRAKWFNVYQYRQIANIVGFVSLMTGVVFGKQNS
ncbi:MAG: hypothetical protein HOP08_19685 [Cyclobacteriaceae bacterium]|nr:hypothetical protein [Cyclobacteriaceae bacterium]